MTYSSLSSCTLEVHMHNALLSVGTRVTIVVGQPQPPTALLHQVTRHIPQHLPLPTITTVSAGTHAWFSGTVREAFQAQ